MRYFVLESRLLAYYKREPQDNMVPIKTVLVDGNFRLEDRGLKTIMDIWFMFYLSIIRKRSTTELWLPRKRFFLHSRQFASLTNDNLDLKVAFFLAGT
ncbi:protein ENHANCED DISEASE RESISTANCE 2-like isoform X2 [Actinidia eriantha]|uniref:protein ENHANCED DISEASE RESISTANCE 2-like isoform X2 n=1 Tax=Actinidia eriantha TaxID=165200 RepID=UPI00258F5F1B|nr:protein ENHANCED DISEASE RESISTANCE 2-like isoform X2 [Actinidia eriantha]